jgi:hypothetical protein
MNQRWLSLGEQRGERGAAWSSRELREFASRPLVLVVNADDLMRCADASQRPEMESGDVARSDERDANRCC